MPCSTSDDSDSSNIGPYKVYKNSYNKRKNENRIIDNIIMSDPFQIFQVPASVPRAPRQYIERDCASAHNRLWSDYFAEDALFNSNMFRQRFRMQKHVFCRIVDAITSRDEYFVQRPDTTGRLSASPLQKCTTTICLLTYGISPDSLEEYLKISGAVARESLHHFVNEIICQFSGQYLRKPTDEDLTRLLYQGEQQGFPGMLGSIDCSCNDINVLDRSPLFNDILEGRAPPVNFVVNGNTYNMGYYLTDGIYPQWASFIQSVRVPVTPKQTLFAQIQGVRKDVEHAFGVLQGRFAIIRNPALAHDKKMLGKIMMTCIILHNMIVEDERETYQNYEHMTDFEEGQSETSFSRQTADSEPFSFSNQRIASLSTYMSNRAQVRNREIHKLLKNDLIKHIWQKFG